MNFCGSGRLGRPQPSKLLQVGFDSHGPLHIRPASSIRQSGCFVSRWLVVRFRRWAPSFPAARPTRPDGHTQPTSGRAFIAEAAR